MTKKNPFWLLLVPLLFIPGCSREASRELPSTIVWHKDQNLIRPENGTMNVWEGISVKKDRFVVDGEVAQFILWRRQRSKAEISVEYSLQGKKVELTVNANEKKMLAPSSSLRWEKFSIDLSRGFNFLRFNKKKKDQLQIRTIAVGMTNGKQEPHLRRGESFTLFLPVGHGRIELHGSGSVSIVEQAMDAGPLPPRIRKLKTGWFSRKITYPIQLSRPAAISVTSLSGQFTIGSYSYQEETRPAASSQARFQGKPDIYIILSDACQPAHLGVYGYERNTSPHIDAFAADAMVYMNAYTNASFTRSSVATLFTGLYPDSHKVRILQHELPSRFLTLPEYLNAKGYHTAILSSSLIVSPRSGFKQGVDDFANFRVLRYRDDISSIGNGLAGWLKKSPMPHFAYMHFMQPHLPTVPPPGFSAPFATGGKIPAFARMIELANKAKDVRTPFSAEELRELILGYDTSIAWMDVEFGKIIALLKQKNLYENSLIIFLADHGEAMKEHGVISHGSNVYDEATRVPLIVKYPKSLALKGRYFPVNELADVFPTLSGLFGQEIHLDGRSLLSSEPARTYNDRMAVSCSFSPIGLYGLRWKNWYYIISTKSNQEQLFQLSADPRLEVSLRFPQVTNYFKARFLHWYGRFRNRADYSTEMNLSKLPASEIEELKTLGYL
jgi:arylsulfatase A-like enzyme